MNNKKLSQILLILSLNVKASVKQNKLLTIHADIQDKRLKELVWASANMYQWYIERFKTRIQQMVKNPKWELGDNPSDQWIQDSSIPYNNNQWQIMQNEANGRLIKYINELIAMNKPDWQVEAERNGWVKAIVDTENEGR